MRLRIEAARSADLLHLENRMVAAGTAATKPQLSFGVTCVSAAPQGNLSASRVRGQTRMPSFLRRTIYSAYHELFVDPRKDAGPVYIALAVLFISERIGAGFWESTAYAFLVWLGIWTIIKGR